MRLSQSFFIKNKKISENSPVYIIAEVGINHNGSKSRCLKLIREAYKSGADAVKLQIVNPDLSYSRQHPSYKEFKNKFLSDQSIKGLIKYANSLGIALFATPGDFESLDRIYKLKMPAIKISSGLLTNLPLILEASKKKLPIILSSGMAHLNEISEAVKICKKNQNKVAILKCTSIYPAPQKTLNLNGINRLKNIFKIPVGYSDHAVGIESSIYSVALGAKIVEKHFTLNKKQKGADHKISILPKQFRKMVNKIRELEKIMGNDKLEPSKQEKINRNYNHRKITAKILIKKGEKITKNNISLKRSFSRNKGIPLKYFSRIIGKKTSKNISKEKVISLKDIAISSR